MRVVLIQNYGKVHRIEKGYKVVGEGSDWYLLANGYHVPKFLCRIVG